MILSDDTQIYERCVNKVSVESVRPKSKQTVWLAVAHRKVTFAFEWDGS